MIKSNRNDSVLEKGFYMKKKLNIIIILLLPLIILSGCTLHKKNNQSFTVATTFYPMYAFTKAIVGNEGTVKMVMPSNVEPHDYEPSAKEMATMVDANAFVYNNPALESWVPRVKENFTDTKVINASAGIPLITHGSGHHTSIDPHLWLSPKRAIQEVENIRDGLCKANPKKATIFKKNAAQYLAKLHQLDKDYAQTLHHVKHKTIITQHMAFSYLAHDYGLKQYSIMGLSEEQEPSPTHLAQLKNMMEQKNIHAIFVESGASNKVAKTLADETNANLFTLNPLEKLTRKQQDDGDDYISIMKQNLAVLKKALQ